MKIVLRIHSKADADKLEEVLGAAGFALIPSDSGEIDLMGIPEYIKVPRAEESHE